MNIYLFIALLFGLQFIYWMVGRWSSKNVSSQEDYFLAGRTVPFFPLMMTFLATQVGGGVILGAAEEAYRFGWPVLFYPLGAVLGLICLGAGIGRKLASFQVSTVSQIFEEVYQSSVLRKMVGALSVISLFMILVAQIIASQKFLVSLGVNSLPLFMGFWAIVIIYTTQGGLRAVISTDLIQAGVFTVVFLGCFGMVYSSQIEIPQGEMTDVSGKLWGWLLMPFLFMLIEQDMAQRCFAGASPRVVSRATLVAGLIMLVVCIVPVFFGCLAKSMSLVIPPGGSVLMEAIAQTTNPSVTALAGCAVLAAIISTATSLINAIGSNIANDFNPKRISQRVICGSIALGAIIFALFFDNIVDILIQSYDLSVSCLFVPLIMALFFRRGHFLAALLSILFGAAGFVLFRLVEIDFPKEVGSLLLSLFGFILGTVRTYEVCQDR